MEKKRKWQLVLILSVLALTIYNILPTLLYYAKPLKSPITAVSARKIAQEISARVDQLEPDALDWISSYCDLLNVHPTSTTHREGIITVAFAKAEDASTLRKFLPRAGALLPFSPAQLIVASSNDPKEVIVQRLIDFRFSDHSLDELFTFVPKNSAEGARLVEARADAVRAALLAPSRTALIAKLLANSLPDSARKNGLSLLAASVLEIESVYAPHPQLAKRLAGRMAPELRSEALLEAFATVRDTLKKEGTEAEVLEFARAERFLKDHAGLFAPYGENPVFRSVEIDAENGSLKLKLHPDLIGAKGVDSFVLDALASVTHRVGESAERAGDEYAIPLYRMANASGHLLLNLELLAKQKSGSLTQALRAAWHPTHPDLVNLPIVTSADYAALSPKDKALCLVVSTPEPSQFETSLYVRAIGLDRIARSYDDAPASMLGTTLMNDVRSLHGLLSAKGFMPATSPNGEMAFELSHFHAPLLAATREEFRVMGHKAALEVADIEQRILTANKLDTAIHDDLLKWDDEYRTAQISMYPEARLEVPAPTKNLFWENVKLSLKKTWRGDERKVLKWGLDLSGGKTVQIELRDVQNRPVTDELAINQGVSELFQRVNGMGVSDISIRQTGHLITLDFPGSGSLSASDLVKASSMHFHVVNEKFGVLNPTLHSAVEHFLQGVWNEALVTHRTDPENVQRIATNHLAQDNQNALKLREQGLKLTPIEGASSEDASLSKVVMFRKPSHQGHPLLIVFASHALEGSSLENILSNYDPTKGNYLSFEVSRSAQERCVAWTSQYCKERIAGTSRDFGSRLQGWRMAVLLNGTVITAPTLVEPIKSSASITGNFSHREVNQLVSDLRAGSLTFTPHILSEKNVSPELGKADRMKGIGAMAVALALVIGAMIAYYRFAGVVASVAVLFNLLILWATLQNIGASLSLAGIAGIILTVGMAVDANVLVFERIKEEFAASGRIASAIRAGYEKAFSAILDSNLTTIIAALILLNFDAGPIKAFAVSMIIGIASSMFTALFMTRFYFEGWVQRSANKTLAMANWIRSSSVDFLKRARLAFSIGLFIIALGGTMLWIERAQIFGMDFTGGYALSIELQKSAPQDSPSALATALCAAGLQDSDFRIRQHSPETHFQIFLSQALEESGKPFHGLKLAGPHENPRLEWVLSALQRSGVQLTSASLHAAETNWTTMSGQMSDTMRNHALIGLGAAFLCIFLYIAIRFEYTYAMAAIGCLLHDVLVTVGFMSLLHACGVPIQIDLNAIAALMTIIGYSLNDTIIIFDRVREDARAHPHHPLPRIVNHAVNATLSRTTITSGTTLLVLLALLALGGASVFSFALFMTVGVVVGTISSWVIACPLMLWFHRRGAEQVEYGSQG